MLDEIASNPKSDKKLASYAINRMGKLGNEAVPYELLVKYEQMALDANTFGGIRIQSLLLLESIDYPKLNDILRTILRDENTTDPEVIGQALLTLSHQSSDENDIKLIDDIVGTADNETIFEKGIAALGYFCTEETIAKIMSHRNHRFATENNIGYGLSRCYNTVLSIAEKANTNEEKSYAIDCLESLGSPDAYYLLKGMRTNHNNPQEIKDKLDNAIDILKIKYGGDRKRKRG